MLELILKPNLNILTNENYISILSFKTAFNVIIIHQFIQTIKKMVCEFFKSLIIQCGQDAE